MKLIKEETRISLIDLSKEELEKTYGGSWWEIIFHKDKAVIIFHPYDHDKPK